MRTRCAKCNAPGPFYASQARPCYCIPCQKAITLARYAERRADIRATDTARRLRRILNTPAHQRTRREQKRLLDQNAPPGKKVCAYCWLSKWPGLFGPMKNSRDGRDSYCRACRRILDAQRRYRKRQAKG
jgi:hypothetical protein